jgi:hypothetical protein
LHSLITEAIALTASGPQPGESAADYDAHVARRRTAIQERAEKFRQYGSVARLVVPAEVRTFLTNFGDSWNGTTTNEARNAVARNAWLGILDRARADLMTEDA